VNSDFIYCCVPTPVENIGAAVVGKLEASAFASIR
jgi:hypothetical protein